MSDGKFLRQLLSYFFLLVSGVAIAIDFVSDGGISSMTYVSLFVIAITGALIINRSQSVRGTAGGDLSTTPHSGNRSAIISNNSTLNLREATIKDHDVGIEALNSKVNANKIRIE